MFGNWFKDSFRETFKNFFLMLGLVLIVGIISIFATVSFLPILGVVLFIVLLLVVGLSYTFYQKVVGENVNGSNLFASFKMPWRVVGGVLWKYLWLFIWFLIPVAGVVLAIKKCYEYSMTEYLLMKYKDIKACDALKLSKKITTGYKGNMFAVNFVSSIIFNYLPSFVLAIPLVLVNLLMPNAFTDRGIGFIILIAIMSIIMIVVGLICIVYFLNSMAVMARTILAEKEDCINEYLNAEVVKEAELLSEQDVSEKESNQCDENTLKKEEDLFGDKMEFREKSSKVNICDNDF